jgi:hypothetical protein
MEPARNIRWWWCHRLYTFAGLIIAVQALQAGQVMMSVCPSVSETNLQPDTSCASAATADCLHLETRRLSAGQQNNMKSLSCYCIRERERISIKIRPERGLFYLYPGLGINISRTAVILPFTSVLFKVHQQQHRMAAMMKIVWCYYPFRSR